MLIQRLHSTTVCKHATVINLLICSLYFKSEFFEVANHHLSGHQVLQLEIYVLQPQSILDHAQNIVEDILRHRLSFSITTIAATITAIANPALTLVTADAFVTTTTVTTTTTTITSITTTTTTTTTTTAAAATTTGPTSVRFQNYSHPQHGKLSYNN